LVADPSCQGGACNFEGQNALEEPQARLELKEPFRTPGIVGIERTLQDLCALRNVACPDAHELVAECGQRFYIGLTGGLETARHKVVQHALQVFDKLLDFEFF
jgi:hypothetical protein